jgi:hypothetical protein
LRVENGAVTLSAMATPARAHRLNLIFDADDTL